MSAAAETLIEHTNGQLHEPLPVEGPQLPTISILDQRQVTHLLHALEGGPPNDYSPTWLLKAKLGIADFRRELCNIVGDNGTGRVTIPPEMREKYNTLVQALMSNDISKVEKLTYAIDLLLQRLQPPQLEQEIVETHPGASDLVDNCNTLLAQLDQLHLPDDLNNFETVNAEITDPHTILELELIRDSARRLLPSIKQFASYENFHILRELVSTYFPDDRTPYTYRNAEIMRQTMIQYLMRIKKDANSSITPTQTQPEPAGTHISPCQEVKELERLRESLHNLLDEHRFPSLRERWQSLWNGEMDAQIQQEQRAWAEKLANTIFKTLERYRMLVVTTADRYKALQKETVQQTTIQHFESHEPEAFYTNMSILSNLAAQRINDLKASSMHTEADHLQEAMRLMLASYTKLNQPQNGQHPSVLEEQHREQIRKVQILLGTYFAPPHVMTFQTEPHPFT